MTNKLISDDEIAELEGFGDLDFDRLVERLRAAEAALEYYADRGVYHCIDHGDLHETSPATARNFDHIPVFALDKKGDKARAYFLSVGKSGEDK